MVLFFVAYSGLPTLAAEPLRAVLRASGSHGGALLLQRLAELHLLLCGSYPMDLGHDGMPEPRHDGEHDP